MKGCGDDATWPQAPAGVGGRVLESDPRRSTHRRGVPANRHRPQDRLPVARRSGRPAAGPGGRRGSIVAVFVAVGTPAHRDAARARARGPRNRSPDRPGALDGVTGALSSWRVAWSLPRSVVVTA